MPNDEITREYSTDAITVVWRAQRCIHSAVCLRGLPSVFDVGRRPWVAPEQAEVEEIAQLIEQCPSGALHYRRLDGGPREQPDQQPSISAVPNGPLLLRGAVEVLDADGNTFRADTRIALCRCGASANKPFCDTSHRRIGFRAP